MRNVRAEGSLNSSIMIVGEAPGGHEVRHNRPFMGPAGQLLNNLMKSTGISRASCYLTNTLSFQPKPSLAKHINIETGAYSDEAISEIARLYDELQQSNAKIVLLTGNAPLYVLTGKADITKRRGSIFFDQRFPGKTFISTIHPAAALRNYLYRYPISLDLLRVKQLLHHEGPIDEILPKRELITRPTYDETMNYLERAAKAEMIGFDIETKRVWKDGKFIDWEVSCLSVALSGESAICIPFLAREGEDYWSLPQEVAIWRLLKEILESPTVTKLGQNIIFDTSFLLRKLCINTWPVEDTMIAQHCLCPDLPKGLDFLASIYTYEPYYKDEGKSYLKLPIDIDSFFLYNAKDSAVLFEIFKKQREELERMGNWDVYVSHRNLIQPLNYMTLRGMKTRKESTKIAAEAINKEIESLIDEFKKLCGYDINPKSSPQLHDYFYKKKKLKPFVKDGKPTLDKTALIRLTAAGHREAKILLTIRKLNKFCSTYMEMCLDLDDRIRTSFNPVGTETGRLSSSKTIFGVGGNLQTLPKDFKRYVLADDNHLIYEVDLSQAENRIVAYCGPVIEMIKAFEDGIDVHSLTGALISNQTLEEVIEQDENDIYAPIAAGDKTWRFWGKSSNHSLNYGQGPNAFALKYEIPLSVAKWIKEQYFRTYPGVTMYQNWIKDLVDNGRTVTNPFGRKRRFIDRRGDELFRQAFAFFPQSTVADIINRHGLLFIYQNPLPFEPIQLLNQIHDSIVFQIPLSHSLEEHATCLQILCNSLESPITWRAATFSIPAAVKVGKSLSLSGMQKIPVGKLTIPEITKGLEDAVKKL